MNSLFMRVYWKVYKLFNLNLSLVILTAAHRIPSYAKYAGIRGGQWMGKEDRIEPWVEDVFVLLWIELAPGRSQNSCGFTWGWLVDHVSCYSEVQICDPGTIITVPVLRANSLHTTFHGPWPIDLLIDSRGLILICLGLIQSPCPRIASSGDIFRFVLFLVSPTDWGTFMMALWHYYY